MINRTASRSMGPEKEAANSLRTVGTHSDNIQPPQYVQGLQLLSQD